MKHRIFIAINLPEPIKRQLFEYSEKYPEIPCRWTAKDNLHITLEFLGHLTNEELGDACVVVKNIANNHQSFSLNINKVLYGPPQLKPGQVPKFVWAQGERSEDLALLKQDLQDSLMEKIRFVPENRALAPHITLARINTWQFRAIEPEERIELNLATELVFTAESIEVMESILKRGGPKYTILESHQLKPTNY